MFFPSPPIDTRSSADVAAATTALVQAYTADPARPGSGWTPPNATSDAGPDAGSAVIDIFAKMATYVIDRINLFPTNAYLAFLNMVGVEPTPPRAALVPLTFSLARGTTEGVLVPAGTQVGAVALPTDTGPVTFETMQDLVVTPAALVAVLSYQPSGDLYADHTAQSTGAAPGFYPAFGDQPAASGGGLVPVEHGLYLAADAVLGLPAGTAVTSTIQLAAGQSSAAWQALSLAWSYWSGTAGAWQPLALTSGTPSSLEIGFKLPSDMAATSVDGQQATWIRVELTSWPASGAIPAVASVTLSASPVTLSSIAPDAATSSAGPLDPSADFYPFGPEPQFNSTFYLASATVLAAAGATVALTVTLSAQRAPLTASDAPIVVWEVWTGSAWLEVGRSTNTSSSVDTPNTYAFSDGTKAFTQNGVVSFTLPPTVVPTTVGGVTSAWLRVRLLGADNYGMGITLSSSGSSLTATNDGYRPPILESVTLAYTITPSAVAVELTYNNLSFAAATPAPSSGFIPFVRLPDVQPALYLGFDQALDNEEMLLYVQIASLSISDLKALGNATTPPTLTWEYSGSAGWAPLGATDETGSLAESGLVSFIGPGDFTPATVLGRSHYWLRVRLAAGSFAAPPRVGLIATNTVWASNTTTTQAEILGSSSGTPSQSFTLLHTPVLEGQQIYVQEPALPPPAEQAALEALEGSDAVLVVPGTQGPPAQTWVRWHGVTDFYASGPRDRHYQIDRGSGVVTFGDGLRGMAPPQGLQNVWSFFYQSGGGAQGNRASGTVNQLKTAIAGVAGVTNYEAASGGSDTQSLAEVEALGPTVLRNSGRAIAAQDYADMALEASPEIARAQLVPPNFDPVQQAQNPLQLVPEAGKVTLLVVPDSDDSPPTPGLGLIRSITTYLQARIAPAVSLTVTGPLWIQLGVTGLTIVPATLGGADALRSAAVTAITAFLHPLKGGFDGAGWAFGQLPQASDIYRLVMAIPGVDAVQGFSLQTSPTPDMTDPDTASRVLIYSGTHTVVVTSPDVGG